MNLQACRAKVKKLLEGYAKRPLIVAVTGYGAAGKTTLSKEPVPSEQAELKRLIGRAQPHQRKLAYHTAWLGYLAKEDMNVLPSGFDKSVEKGFSLYCWYGDLVKKYGS